MAKTTDPKTYAKNVLRSVGYITKETIKGVNPTLTSYITDTVSSTKDMYESVKDFKRSFTGKLDADDALNDVKNVKSNILDDIKSGKFYNPEREQKAIDSYMRSEGFSFDDFDFDDLDNEVEKDDSEAPSKDVMQRVGASIAMSNQKMTALSTDQITKGARNNTRASMIQNKQLFGMVNTSLASINGSILNLHNDLAQPLNNHITNSTTFFQFATSELAKQTSYLEKISKTLDDRFAPPKNKGFSANRQNSAWEEIMSGGLPDVGRLAKTVKKRAWDDSLLGMMSDFISPDMLSMLSGTGGLSSPIAMILSMGLTSKLQKGATGKALERTVDTLRGGFTHTAARISAYNAKNWVETKSGEKKNKNGLLGMIADILDITPKKNNKIDFSNYEKGRVDWSGMDDKALREVIPTQLASILSAITREDAKIFNYKTGRWETANKVAKNFKSDRSKNISNSISGFRSDVTREFLSDANAELGGNILSENSRATMSFKSDFDTLMQLIAISGKNPATLTKQELDKLALNGVNKWVGKNVPGGKQYPVNIENYRRIKNIIFRPGSMTRARFSGAVIDAQMADNRFIEEAGQGSFAQIANGSGLKGAKKNSLAGTIFEVKDKYNRNLFDYLQSYWKQLQTIQHYVSTGNFGAVGAAERGNGARSSRPYVARLTRIKENPAEASTARVGTPFTDITDANASDIRTSDGKYKPVGEFAGTNKYERKQEEKSSPISRGIDKINDFLAKLFLGEHGSIRDSINAEGGLRGWIASVPEKINTGIQKLFDGVKDKISGWFKKHFTEEDELGTRTLKSAKDIIKGFGKSVAAHAVNSAGDVVEWVKGQRPDWATGTVSPTAYRGGTVRKSGMVSVSEGEMIIPSEYNPFYKGISNKSAQKFTEARNYRNWAARGAFGGNYWGSYANGSLSMKERRDMVDEALDKATKKNIDKLKAAKMTDEFISDKLGIDIKILKDYIFFKGLKQKALQTASKGKKKADETVASAKDQFAEAGAKAKDALTEAKNKILGGADRVTRALFGDDEKYAKAKDLGKSALDTIKADLPKSLASAGIGAIIGGALTGSGLGLLGGMVLGAGTMVIKNSDKINSFLFGSQDEEGNWSGGKIPAKASNFIKKRLPSLAKSGALGSILGTIGVVPGGVLGGLVIGAGVDLLAHNETVKEGVASALFGSKDINGERHGGIFGMLKVRVVDPLANFVKEGTKTIGDYIKENFLKPVTKIFDPLKDWVKGFGKNVGDKLANAFKAKVHRTFTELADSTIGRGISAVGRAGKKVLGAAGTVASLPFKGVGLAGDLLAAHNIRAGYSSASATDRVKASKKFLSPLSKHDYKASGLEAYNLAASNGLITDEDFANMSILTGSREKDERALVNHNQDVRNTVVASLKNAGLGNPRLVKEITDKFNSRSANSGDYNDIYEFLKNGVGEDQLSNPDLLKIQKYLFGEAKDKFKEKQGQIDANEAKRQEFAKRTGVNLKSAAVQRQMGVDTGKFEKQKAEEEAKKQAEKQRLDDALKQNPIENEQINIDRERNTVLTSIQTLVTGIANKVGVDVSIPKTEEIQEGEKRQNPNTGRMEEYRGGKWQEDYSDAETKADAEEEEERNGLQSKFYKTVLGSGLIAGLTGLFGKKKEDTGEKKKTLWDTIKEKIFGDDGIFGSSGFLSKLFGSGSLLATGLTTLTGLLPTIAGVAGAGAVGIATQKEEAGSVYDSNMVGAAGDADGGEARANASKESANKGGFLNSVKTGWAGLQTLENKIKKKNVASYKSEDAYISPYAVNRVAKKAVKNVITGQTITKGGKLLNKGLNKAFEVAPKAAKAVAKGASKVGSALSTAGSAVGWVLKDTAVGNAASAVANNSIVQKIVSPIKTVFKWLFKKLGKEGGEEVAEEAAEKIGKEVAEKGGSALLKNLGTAVKVATIALAVEDGIEEGGAMSILGITETPTLTQRLLAGAINGINEAIPGIGGIIKTSTLFSIVYNVLEKLGFDFGDLANQRAKAQEELAAYQELHPGAELDEYIKNDPEEGGLGKRTTQDKIKLGVKKGFKAITNGGKSFGAAVSTLGTKVSAGLSTAKDWALGSGSGVHVSQTGSRKFGRSTLGANGCGPAAAATVLRAYGKNSDLNSAANFAEANGYVAGSSGAGTRASYFSDIFGSNGIKSSYTQSKGSMQNAINSGKPTVLLGQDKSNHSKANSPFGPNPHYVVARGSDAKGNILVDDPELNKSALYKKDILKSAKLGVLTGGDSGITIKDSDGAVWNYLKSAGLNDYGTAGLMGNLYAESGITFNKVEGASIKKNDSQSHDYERDHGFKYDSASYTSAVDKGISQGLQGSDSSNAKPTFGVIPKYEFTHMPWKTSKQKPDGTYWGQNGYGLVQWTTAGRKEGLYNLAVQNKKSISDPETQLTYLLQELQSSYSPVLSTLKSAKSVKEASDKVLIDFESPASRYSEKTQNLRAGYGQTYYNQFTKNPPKNTDFGSAGTLATVNVDTTGSTSDSSSGTSSSSSSSSFSLSSILSDTFGNLFKTAAEKVGGVGGKILNLITGGLVSSSGTENNGTSGSTNSSESAANMGGVETSSSNTTQENAIVSKMNSILGTCSYSMEGARNPEKGSADCSSTVQWVLRKAIGKDPGGDTDSILNSSNGAISDKYSSGDPTQKTSSGPNLSNLRPGDLLLYSRPNSSYTEGRKYRVGHVEMYMGDGKRAGHGSGTGPIVTDATNDSARYIMAKRYTDATATGSGIPLYDFTKGDAFKGGASNTSLPVVDASNVSRNADQNAQLAQILLYTKQIASNTGFNASIPTIVDVLRTYGDVLTQMNASGAASTASTNSQTSDNGNVIQTEISSMMAKLDAIAGTL